MYFPVGWPKRISLALPGETSHIRHICCDAVKILVAAVGDDFLGIWYANPLIPIAYFRRTAASLEQYGANQLIIWKPDSRQLAILTAYGVLLLYQLDFDANGSGILQQVDPPAAGLKRDSAELFIKENIPRLSVRELCSISLSSVISAVCCISLSELLLATQNCELLRLQWTQLEAAAATTTTTTGTQEEAKEPLIPLAAINLREIPFYVHQSTLAAAAPTKCLPPIANDAYIASLEYSPFIGGCAAVFSDNRAAFLVANHLRFETEQMHGCWVPDVEDASVCSVNHKFRLLAYGQRCSDVAVYAIDDVSGGLEFSHRLRLTENVLPGSLGAVCELKWSPDGCVVAVCWSNGGLALWSTFGALLMSTLSWDFGLHVDLLKHNPLKLRRLEWSTEGYQMFMTTQGATTDLSNVLQLQFVKSALSMNPCMSSNPHMLLQGDECVYINHGHSLEQTYGNTNGNTFPNSEQPQASQASSPESPQLKDNLEVASKLAESKYWTQLQLPLNYAATNWPIRYAAIDADGQHLAIAGRTGLAHYTMHTRKWKLFGNESQEKDFVVSGGLLWWEGFIVMGCYSLLDRTDELRCYPAESKLDNQFGHKLQLRAPVISLNVFRAQLIALTADGIVSVFNMTKLTNLALHIECAYELDVKSICIHPACIVSLTVTNLRNELKSQDHQTQTAETIIVNVCGRILMIQRDSQGDHRHHHSGGNNSGTTAGGSATLLATCLASCVECFWLSDDCLWLFSGAHGMRVWMPISPPAQSMQRKAGQQDTQRLHSFMCKRIMLSFPLKLYPLVILFDNVIVLGVENDSTLYTSEVASHFALPFALIERKSQVYLHRLLRQLIKRNLGYAAWELAQSCRSLPYFPHALELLLHEVLEEEATSKQPIPDAQLPSILDFIREFPVYLQTIVQCARKTEIALWPYLFSMAGKPKELFQLCLQEEQLDTAASYLIILQNLEPSLVSKQYATMLLDIALQQRKWELAKDLIRFLKAIDPNEIDSPRSSMIVNVKIAPPAPIGASIGQHTTMSMQHQQNPDVFNLVLGPIARERSYSTKDKPNLSANLNASNSNNNNNNSSGNNISSSSNNNTNNNNTSDQSIVSDVNTVMVRRRSTKDQQQLQLQQQQLQHQQQQQQQHSSQQHRQQQKAETFCIDLILQRHARQLLQHHKLLELGYMCAYLDFHLVTWLTQQSERAAKLDDFAIALQALHQELHLPAPFGNSTDYQLLLRRNTTSSHTSESGYFSLAHVDSSPAASNRHETSPTQDKDIHELEENLAAMEMMSGGSQSSTSYLPDKLSIKLRYLLQLFIEANCTDYALVLSILLQDAASIGRIVNVLIRTESMVACRRVESALRCLMQCAFEQGGVSLYRSFLLSLQPHLQQLEQHNLSTATAFANSTMATTSAANSNNNNVDVNNLSSTDTDSVIDSHHDHEHSINGERHHHLHHQRLSRHLSLESSGSQKGSLSQPLTMMDSSQLLNKERDKDSSACVVM